jgi:acetylornithine deacetylase/succinyl-diaminopimelate desuccinylase-like protein
MATAGKATLSDNVRDAITSRIREDELVSMCCEVINIPSPTGGELAMAEYMRAAFQKLGRAAVTASA